MVNVERVTTGSTALSERGEPQQPWKPWWLWCWGVVAVALIVLIPFVPFKWWGVAALVGFGTLEGFGLSSSNDGYPPLTQAIRRYVPRWVAFSLIYGLTGGAGATWLNFPHPLRFALLVGLLGWFNAHFDVTFDNDAVQEERCKYQMLHQKVRRIRQRLRRGGPSNEATGSVAVP